MRTFKEVKNEAPFSELRSSSVVSAAAYFDMILGKNLIVPCIKEIGLNLQEETVIRDGFIIKFSQDGVSIKSCVVNEHNEPLISMFTFSFNRYSFSFFNVNHITRPNTIVHIDKIRKLMFSSAILSDIFVDNIDDFWAEIMVKDMILI